MEFINSTFFYKGGVIMFLYMCYYNVVQCRLSDILGHLIFDETDTESIQLLKTHFTALLYLIK
jgi:hypothetical protein